MELKRYSVAFAEYDGVEVKAMSSAKAKAKLWRMYDDAYPNSTTFFIFVSNCRFPSRPMPKPPLAALKPFLPPPPDLAHNGEDE